MDNYLILLYSIAGLLFVSLGVSIVFMVKLPKLLIVTTKESVDNVLRGNVNYKFDYTKTKISNNKICHLAGGRCDEEQCYAFCFHDGIARCNEYFLEFTNYKNKRDR